MELRVEHNSETFIKNSISVKYANARKNTPLFFFSDVM